MARLLASLPLGIALACAGAGPVAPAVPPPDPVPVPVVVVAPPPPPEPAAVALAGLASPPEGWVDLRAHLPGARFDIRYHTVDNFTGTQLPGYGAPGAWLRAEPGDALALVQQDLAEKGLGLLIYDGYRPLRGTKGMVAWAKRTDNVALLDNGYVSRYSGHNRGNTVDLSVVDAQGVELDMGTPWDTLSEASHTRNATGAALEHRLLLKAAMEARGFRNYFKEWWHYTFVVDGEKEMAHRDVPYGCAEPPEGAWKPPAGWDVPGWQAPAPTDAAPCR